MECAPIFPNRSMPMACQGLGEGAVPNNERSAFGKLADRAVMQQKKIPLMRALPPRALGIMLLIAFVNCIVWIAVGIILVCFKIFESNGKFAWR